MKLHLIMPMGGHGHRFFDKGFVIPKPLIEIHGKPFFYWSAMSVMKLQPECDIRFVVLQEHIRSFEIDKAIRSYFPDAAITVILEVLPGAVMTCLAGAADIRDGLPVLFNDCDHMFRCDALAEMSAEQQAAYDGLLLTFASDSPKFSYVSCDADGRVLRTVEKEVISNDAICGAYYFRNSRLFEENAAVYLQNCSYSEYFMSGVYNCMADRGLRSGVLRTDFHVSFGTPEEYAQAEKRPEFEVFA